MKASTRPEIQPPITPAQIEIILRIYRQQAAMICQLKRAILDGDSELEHALARQVCGLPREQQYERGERIL